jgi:hypothetical protein
VTGRYPDITETELFRAAAAEARDESRRYWAANNEKHPLHKEARFWPLQRPRDPDGILFLNARGVRVLSAILELLQFGDVGAIESLIFREITRVPECP